MLCPFVAPPLPLLPDADALPSDAAPVNACATADIAGLMRGKLLASLEISVRTPPDVEADESAVDRAPCAGDDDALDAELEDEVALRATRCSEGCV